MNKINVYQIIAVAMAWMALSGCSPLQKDFHSKNYFSLKMASMERPEFKSQDWKPKGLLVQDLSIAPEFATNFFVYQISSVQYRQDYYNQFMVPPARMITSLLRENLYESGAFRPVSASAPVDIDFRLSGKIVGLYVDMKDAAHPCCVLSMRLILDEKQGGSGQGRGFTQVLSRLYKARVPVPSKAAKTIALGWSECGKQILHAFYEDLNRQSIIP